VSVRSPENLYYATELPGPDATVVYTRQAPPSSTRPAGRIHAADVEPHLRDDATVYVCGSAQFTDAVGDLVLELGVPAERVRVERFGPSA
jgi:ferredoxin-NADP reductase